MNAGWELDRLVHDKVMGGFEKLEEAKSQREFEQARKETNWCPSYSTDIAAAWTVVEKIKTDPRFEYLRTFVYEDEVYVNIEAEWAFSDRAKTFPHAVCLAALKAKGVEV